MFNVVSVVVVCFALATSIVIEGYALFRNKGNRQNYFLLMQAMVILYLLGYLLELSSTTSEEAYAGVKVLYVGAYFVAVFAFFFTADYCGVRLHTLLVKAPMLLLSGAIVVAMWTTKFHRLIYADYAFNTTPINRLSFTPGPLYSLIHTYPSLCMVMAALLLLCRMRKWKNKYRRELLLFLACIIIPFIAEGVYFIATVTGINKYQLYFTPHSIALMSFCVYLGILRFNIFEFISVATVTAMEHIREGFILVDESCNYLSSNPAAARMLPGIAELVKGECIFRARGWPEELRDFKTDEAEFALESGGMKHYTASISPVFAKTEDTVLARIILLREITDSVNLMSELKNAAYMDALTGLYNRKHFSELANVDIERALRLNQSIYAVMLDLDLFKKVNDTHGHLAGDAVLKATAAIVRQTIRSYDLLGRYGGEEFVLLITDLDASEALRLMERIRENTEHNVITYNGSKIKITCSIGLVEFREGDTLESAIKKADEALYTAKHSGRNKVRVYGA